jgi:hypothetical protein
VVLGGFISLFTAGPALFADGPFGSRLAVLGFSAVGFVSVGLLIGFSAPLAWKPASICLALSALPVVAFFGPETASQLPMAMLSVGFALGDFAAGVFGVWAGMRLRVWRIARHPAEQRAAENPGR